MRYNLKQVRELSGKKQTEVAEDLGISLSTYRSWEQGKRNLNGRKISLLADYFGVSADTIIGTEYAEPIPAITISLSPDEEYLIGLYRQMTEEDKRSFVANAQVYAYAGEAKKNSVYGVFEMAENDLVNQQ